MWYQTATFQKWLTCSQLRSDFGDSTQPSLKVFIQVIHDNNIIYNLNQNQHIRNLCRLVFIKKKKRKSYLNLPSESACTFLSCKWGKNKCQEAIFCASLTFFIQNGKFHIWSLDGAKYHKNSYNTWRHIVAKCSILHIKSMNEIKQINSFFFFFFFK